ncbi:cytochrome C [Dissulfurirhabdus thermomarina]|uniref:Cytochrome C n=1 Tax=Dissulfurirhabdus thermomarina TaxID=1765737 RepID=A0A6N9TLV7_DISTH|nr:cytochrome C [Dissulfurirhabdus thermomarina]NDY41420.1 cytochrome C [Dissulfurirhabdus thermomarina]NMX24408.1 cytochrome C [Dissulfurirhabdus thermomarina]
MRRKRGRQCLVPAGMALALGLAFSMPPPGAAMAAVPEHAHIVLRDHLGNPISPSAATDNAFSVKGTCGCCHDGTNGLLSYDELERHSYHAQLAANEIRGWNAWNPDSPDKFRSGPAAKGKNWVQSPGHVGKW